jgi:diguanylate cyclase (GGDEF)-like protein
MKVALVGLDELAAHMLDQLWGNPDVEIVGVAGDAPEEAAGRWPGLRFVGEVSRLLGEGPELILLVQGDPTEIRSLSSFPPDAVVLPLRHGDPMRALLAPLVLPGERAGGHSGPDSGLLPPGEFERRMELEMMRATRYNLNVGLIIFYVNDLEDYEERNGRLMRDLVLEDIASIIGRNTRQIDVAARLEDDRMAVLLPETGRLGTLRLAERIRIVVEEYPFPSRDLTNVERLTVNGGISTYPSIADNRDELVKQAHDALEEAMRAGRNRTNLYNKGTE